MENVNRLLLENVLPAHVAAHFIGDKLNEVQWSATRGREAVRAPSCMAVLLGYRLLSLPSLRPHAPRRQCVPLAAGHRPWGQRPGRRQPRFPGPRVPFCEAGPPPAWQAGRARQRQAFVTQIETRAFPPVPCGSVTAKEQACEWGAGS